MWRCQKYNKLSSWISSKVCIYLLKRSGVVIENLSKTFISRNISVSDVFLRVTEYKTPKQILCSAQAFPLPNYSWKFQGQEVSKSAFLDFPSGVTRHDTGSYICEASNRHGVMQAKTQETCLMKLQVHFLEETLIKFAFKDPLFLSLWWKIWDIVHL